MIIPILLVKKLRHKELNSLPVVGHTEQMEEPTPEFQGLGSSLLRIMRNSGPSNFSSHSPATLHSIRRGVLTFPVLRNDSD